MKRIVLWLASTATVLVLLFGYRTSTNATPLSAGASIASAGRAGATSAAPSSTSSSGTSTAADASTAAGASTAAASASPSSTSPAAAAAATTSYTGSVAQTRWGPVQVDITVSAGHISAVDVVQYPQGNGRDQQINAYALPILVQDTLNAQSAKIDMVSGATVTSNGYVQSLQSALDQAGL